MNSSAFKKFKREMGQANHFLITIMIGLDAVDDGAQKREEFKTSWNPQNVSASVRRSKQYSIKAALAWAVDNLDMYLRSCNKNPRLYQEEESLEISKTKHSIYNKYKCVIKNHPQIANNQKAFVDLLICWRNNMIHYDAENEMLPESKKYFENVSEEDVVINTYHLNVNSMLKNFEDRNCPTFKEITTLISMTIHFVEKLDELLLNEVQQDNYLEKTLYLLLKNNSPNMDVFSFRNTTPEKRVKKIKQLLATVGINNDFYNEQGNEFLEKISKMRAEEFLDSVTEK